MNFEIEHLESVTSTNSILYERGLQGAAEGCVLSADEQTGGRGRFGREFYSPMGNLYFSLLLRPEKRIDELRLLTPLAAVCVLEAVEEVLHLSCGIKWVNDLYYNGKKVCGILTEIHPRPDFTADFCVIGIGINVYRFPVPEKLQGIAGGLVEREETKRDLREDLMHCILQRFAFYYDQKDRSFMKRYRSSSILIGKKVIYETAAGELPITVTDINDAGELVVRDSLGEIRTLSDGEVRLKEKTTR